MRQQVCRGQTMGWEVHCTVFNFVMSGTKRHTAGFCKGLALLATDCGKTSKSAGLLLWFKAKYKGIIGEISATWVILLFSRNIFLIFTYISQVVLCLNKITTLAHRLIVQIPPRTTTEDSKCPEFSLCSPYLPILTNQLRLTLKNASYYLLLPMQPRRAADFLDRLFAA